MLLLQTRRVGFVVLCFCWVTFVANAQDDAPTHPVDGEYIKEWLVLGPFFPNDLESDFLVSVGGEANIHPKESDTVTTADGKTLTWTRYTSERNVVDLLDAIGNHENATAYAFCLLQSDTADDAEILFGNDDAAAIWLNGTRIHSNPAGGVTYDRHEFEARLQIGVNRCLVKVIQYDSGWGLAMRIMPPDYAVISGVITHEEGYPVAGTVVRLEQRGETIAQQRTDASGTYHFFVYPVVDGGVDLLATSGDLGDLRLDIPLQAGDRRKIDLTLKRAISIEGQLLMLDDKTPHVACVVQAVMPLDGSGEGGTAEPTVIATTLTDENGRFKFVNLLPRVYHVRCYTSSGYVYYGDNPPKPHGEGLHVAHQRTLSDINFRIPPFKKGTWKNYNSLDGLAFNAIWGMYQSRDGAMWFGTVGRGVSRFDGKTFTTFTSKDGLEDNSVLAIHQDADGAMWFGGWGGDGVSRYDGKQFVTFTEKDGLGSYNVWAIQRGPDGAMWFGTAGGLTKYDGQKFINFTKEDGLSPGAVQSLYQAPDGTMWIGTRRGLSRYDGTTFQNFTTADGLAGNRVVSIYRDPDGVMWFGTNAAVSRYDGATFVNFTAEDGLLDQPKHSIYRDPDGGMWFGNFGTEGLSRYDGTGFVNFTKEDGLASNWAWMVHGGTDGTMWVGTWGSGVSHYDAKGVVRITTQDGLPTNYVRTFHRDDNGVIWTATGISSRWSEATGVTRYDGREVITFTVADGLPSNNVVAIHQDLDGAMWFGTMGGLTKYDGQKLVNFTTKDGLAGNSVGAIHQSRDGTMWFGTNGGVSKYDGKGLVTPTELDGLSNENDEVTAIHQDRDGTMWFGTRNGHLSRYDGKVLVSLAETEGFGGFGGNLSAIYQTVDGAMWFAQGSNRGGWGGITRYDGETFVNLTETDGLQSHSFLAIHGAPDGVMWFGTFGGGVALYDGISWSWLDTRDGIGGNIVWQIQQDKDGFLWLATGGGLTRYWRRQSKPSVHVVSVESDRIYDDLSAIAPITTGTRTKITYNAIDFLTHPDKRQYRVRIEGIDDDWRPATMEASFNYTFTKPGSYTFFVQAINRDLNYSEPTTLTLHVKRPWWHYVFAGFILGGIPLVGAGFYFGKRLQTQRAIAQQFNPYIAGRVVGEDLFYGRSDLITDIERTLANNCFLLYGERRIGKTSLQHQLRERLGNADDPTYRFIPAYIDLQGVAEEDFFRTIATGIVEACPPHFQEELTLRIDEERESYTYRDLNRDLRTLITHLKENETKTIKLVLLMDEVDTLNTYSLRTNLNLRGLFMGPLRENLVLVMSGLFLKMDWSDEGGGSPPFNFLSREIQIEPLEEAPARQLITEPAKGFYTYEPKAVDLILSYSELKPFTIQGICLRAVNRVLADGRTKITALDIEAIKDSALTELQSIRGERAGTSLPASLNEALALLHEEKSRVEELEAEIERLREAAA